MVSEKECKKVDGFGERLKSKRKELKLTRSQVAERLGVAISTIQAWEGGEREPPISMLLALAQTHKVDPNYLLTGITEQAPKQESLVNQSFEKERKILNDGITMIDSYESVSVSAGFGSFNDGVTEPDGEEPYSDGLLATLGVKSQHCAVFWASGNSMQPTITNGDQLLVDLSRKEVKGDKVYLVQNGDSVWVKRVKLLWDRVELISDNIGEYSPISISKEEAQNLQIIGQVVYIGHKLI